MSHQPERSEKDCLNCGTIVQGRYCQACGQENIDTHLGFWALCRHFIYDVFHFDGAFFDTLRHLLFRPGYVPQQYIRGKRRHYLDPIRMYLFTSAVFFIIFFSIVDPRSSVKETDNFTYMTRQERFEEARRVHSRLREGNTDSSLQRQLGYFLDSSYALFLEKEPDSSEISAVSFFYPLRSDTFLVTPQKLTGRDTALNIYTRIGWMDKTLEEKWRTYKQRYGDDTRALISDLMDSYFHRFPIILFISLPFFALLLKLLYLRRKTFLYFDHAIFTLYQYIFTFILLLFVFLLNYLGNLPYLGFLEVLGGLLFFSGGIYLFIAMKRFYGQGRGKTFLKFMLLNIGALLVLLLLMTIFIIISFIQL